ncbi:hypothetical protein D3C83_174490 [compost metagenome]
MGAADIRQLFVVSEGGQSLLRSVAIQAFVHPMFERARLGSGGCHDDRTLPELGSGSRLLGARKEDSGTTQECEQSLA